MQCNKASLAFHDFQKAQYISAASKYDKKKRAKSSMTHFVGETYQVEMSTGLDYLMSCLGKILRYSQSTKK